MKIDYAKLNYLPKKTFSLLQETIEDISFDGTIKAETAKKLAETANFDEINLMLKLLPAATLFAKPEISNFKVGAIVQGESGNLYFGCNIEYLKEGQTFTEHAEQSAIINAFQHSEKGIKRLTTSYIPCALCRQFIKETVSEKTLEIVLTHKTRYNLSDLFPHSFGPEDLGIKKPLLSITERNLKLLNNNHDNLTLKALEAAKKSYAPYTKNYAGIALLLNDGRTVAGRIVENAAFDINHTPLSGALIILNFMGISHSKIKKAVLVEENTETTQSNQVRILLGDINPNIELTVKKAAFILKKA